MHRLAKQDGDGVRWIYEAIKRLQRQGQTWFGAYNEACFQDPKSEEHTAQFQGSSLNIALAGIDTTFKRNASEFAF